MHETEFARDLLTPVLDCDVASILGTVPALVLDGESDTDIETAARMILSRGEHRVCAGPAALAAALANQMQPTASNAITIPRIHRCLAVNGSLHPASRQQMAWAKSNGIFAGGWRVIHADSPGDGRARALGCGKGVAGVIDSYCPEGLIVFGGDTAFGIHHALGAHPFESLGEIAPGVPLSRSHDLYWITKAGGFGPPDLLGTIRRVLA